VRADSTSEKLFSLIHRKNLVYNCCWEDPEIDRIAMNLSLENTVMVITSAGCNALDYALENPKRIYAVDVNPKQNFLIEFKIAGIKHLSFDDFFALFGRGHSPWAEEIYRDVLRKELSIEARGFWDRKICYFSGDGRRSSFYFRGAAGLVARTVNYYIDYICRLRRHIDEILEAPSLEAQRYIYETHLKKRFWSPLIRGLIKSNSLLFLVGVPPDQKDLLNRTYRGGVEKLVEDCLDYVFTRLPLKDNYFWRVYLTGSYSIYCRPEYLKPENFERLKRGLVDKIEWHTGSVSDFLERHDGTISHFVLLDHMDWLAANQRQELVREWLWLARRAGRHARILWRSAGDKVDYINPLEVEVDNRIVRLEDILSYQTEQAKALHEQDRVHMYGSFYIADLCPA
jgi:S-adenosylmethionine-diacylglycerol 3-amino-3-carboxypropyl transferase